MTNYRSSEQLLLGSFKFEKHYFKYEVEILAKNGKILKIDQENDYD